MWLGWLTLGVMVVGHGVVLAALVRLGRARIRAIEQVLAHQQQTGAAWRKEHDDGPA